MISAAGTVDYSLATLVIQALVFGIIIAEVCQSLVYHLFPDDPPKIVPSDNSSQKQQNEQAPEDKKCTSIQLDRYSKYLNCLPCH